MSMQTELKVIGRDLISKTFPHMFPSLNNILSFEVTDDSLKLSNPVKEVVFMVKKRQVNMESSELTLEALHPELGEGLVVCVEVLKDKTLNYLQDPPAANLVKIFDRSC